MEPLYADLYRIEPLLRWEGIQPHLSWLLIEVTTDSVIQESTILPKLELGALFSWEAVQYYRTLPHLVEA